MYEHLSNPGAVRRILDKYDIRFRKRFGQNFLIREDVVEDIVDGAGITERDDVIEVGRDRHRNLHCWIGERCWVRPAAARTRSP